MGGAAGRVCGHCRRYVSIDKERNHVDYALEPDNAAWVYEMSRGLGFVPFVGSRALDRYVEPVP